MSYSSYLFHSIINTLFSVPGFILWFFTDNIFVNLLSILILSGCSVGLYIKMGQERGKIPLIITTLTIITSIICLIYIFNTSIISNVLLFTFFLFPFNIGMVLVPLIDLSNIFIFVISLYYITKFKTRLRRIYLIWLTLILGILILFPQFLSDSDLKLGT